MASRLPKLLPCLLGAGCGLAVALGSASPAEAIVYNFNNAAFTYNSNNYTITGSFDYDSGTNAITSFTNIRTSLWFAPVTDAPNTASYSSNVLTFTDTDRARDQVIAISNFSLNGLPNQTITLSTLTAGSLRVQACTTTNPGNCGSSNNTGLSFTGGTLTSVPFGPSGLMLAPLSALIFFRNRFRKLVIKPLQPVSA